MALVAPVALLAPVALVARQKPPLAAPDLAQTPVDHAAAAIVAPAAHAAAAIAHCTLLLLLPGRVLAPELWGTLSGRALGLVLDTASAPMLASMWATVSAHLLDTAS